MGDESVIAKPRVIPTNQLVVLRESELDCDLGTAIQRVREDKSTSTSRILIVGPDTDPPTPTSTARLPLPNLPMSIGQVARCGGAQALEAAGARLLPKVESLDCLLLEVSAALQQVEEGEVALPTETQRKLATVRNTLEWVRANVQDLDQEARGQVQGFQSVDLAELLADVRGQVESFFPVLRVNVAPTHGTVWGRAPLLTEALFLALVITAHRINGQGSVNVEVETRSDATRLRIFGLGEPVEVHAPGQMTRLRDIVVTTHGGRVLPDAMGPFGAGLVLEIPGSP